MVSNCSLTDGAIQPNLRYDCRPSGSKPEELLVAYRSEIFLQLRSIIHIAHCEKHDARGCQPQRLRGDSGFNGLFTGSQVFVGAVHGYLYR